jgi:uncharacterized membrane protein
MEGSTEARLRSLESRLDRIERLLSIETIAAPPEPAPAARAPLPAAPPLPPPARPARPPRDLEDVFGGRVLAWVGGVAVVLGVVFFLGMAVRRGWIDEPTRVVLAFLGSTALLAAALWLYERRGQTQAALAAAAAALASLYASVTVATVVYDLVPAAAGLLVAALVGAAGAAIAVRWGSRVVGGVGILGALLAPVLVDAGASTGALAFMAVALVAAVAVLVRQGWPWLAFGAFAVSAPQLAAWISDESGAEHGNLAPIVVVLALYWALFLAGALAYELRAPLARVRTSSALLLFANALFVSAEGWHVLDDAGQTAGATAWVLALAAAHVAIGAAAVRDRRAGDQAGALVVALGVALSAVGLALALDGPALVAGWAVEAVLLAWVGARSGDRRATIGAAGFLSLALGHALVLEAPPRALADGLDDAASGIAALAIVAVAAALVARLTDGAWRARFAIVGAATGVYLVSVAIVDASGATEATGPTQGGQLLLSAFWGATGLAAVVAGLLRNRRELRVGGLTLLGIAVAKVFLVDLHALGSIYRVASFVALGLLLIAGAYAYQRVRHEARG